MNQANVSPLHPQIGPTKLLALVKLSSDTSSRDTPAASYHAAKIIAMKENPFTSPRLNEELISLQYHNFGVAAKRDETWLPCSSDKNFTRRLYKHRLQGAWDVTPRRLSLI